MLKKKLIKTIFATTAEEMITKVKEAHDLGFMTNIEQLQPTKMIYTWGEQTFKIELYTYKKVEDK